MQRDLPHLRAHPSRSPARCRARGHAGFTLLELQIAVLLLAFGVVTLASLMVTQSRVMHKLQGDFAPGATVCVSRPADPWVKKLNTPARITALPLTQPAPPTITAANNVTIVSQTNDLNAQSISVRAEVTPIP